MKIGTRLKGFLSMLIILMIVLMLLPITALADDPLTEKIVSVDVNNVPTPIEGKSCDTDDITITTNPADAAFGVATYWYDATAGAKTSSSDSFIRGHEYYIAVELQNNAGYAFDSASGYYMNTATIDGVSGSISSADVDAAGTRMVIQGKKERSRIANIDISGITMPAVGANPDFDGELGDAPYRFADKDEIAAFDLADIVKKEKNGICWQRNFSDYVEDTDIFDENGEYCFIAVLIPNDGYSFASAVDIEYTINGFAGMSLGSFSIEGGYMVVQSMYFDPIKPIYMTAVNSSTSALEVRKTPEETSNRIGGLIKDSVIRVLEEVEYGGTDWYKIVYGSEVGYVKKQYTDGKPSVATVQVSPLNVRAKADESAPRIGGLVKGQDVVLLDRIDTDGDSTSEWGRIIYDNKVAYVIASALGSFGVGGGTPEYSIISGDDQTYSGSGDIFIKADGDIVYFEHLEMDDVKIDESNYTVTAGITVITLKENYLKALTPGEHRLKFVYTDGSVVANLNVPVPSGTDPGAGGGNTQVSQEKIDRPDPFVIFLQKTIQQIASAKEGATVTIDFGDFNVLTLPVMKQMAMRRDLTIQMKYRHKGQKFEVTFPAGMPIKYQDDIRYYGPLKLTDMANREGGACKITD